MTRLRCIALGVLLGLFVGVGPAGAQILTGSLAGTATDESGGVLPGAFVTVTSPALIAGSASTTTSERGLFRFPSLAPGQYTLEVRLADFATYIEPDVQIDLGSTVERTITLKVAGIAESVAVDGGRTLDAEQSGLAGRFTSPMLTAIPVRRFSMFDFIKAAPGVSPTSSTSGTDNTVSVLGSSGNENLFLLDGTNFTCPCSGGAAPQPDVDVIEEVRVDTLGASAEFGNIQGGVFNVVTKRGGDVFTPDFAYYTQAQDLTARPVLLPCPGCAPAQTGYTRVRYRDFTTHLGGPIVRDRVWFFAGYQYLRDIDSQAGTDARFPRTSEYDKVSAKITWQITPRLTFVSSLHDEFWVSPQRPTVTQPFETTVRISGTRPTATLGHLAHTLSDHTLWDVRVSRLHAPQTSEPSTGDRGVPNRVDLATGIQSGGPQGFGGFALRRTTVAGSVSHYRHVLRAAHELKAGVQLENGSHSAWTAFAGNVVRYTDNAGQPVQAAFREPFTTGGQFVSEGLFAMDTVRFADRFTASVGLRFDHARAISPALIGHDAAGNETGETISGLGTLYTWNVLSPRLGLTVKLTRDGRTLARASYGRFHQGVLTGELAPVHPGLTPTTTAGYEASTGLYSRPISVVDPTINVRIDPATRSPQTDQFGIGIEREIPARIITSVSYVHKRGSDVIGWTDAGGTYREETRTLPDASTLAVSVLTNGTAARRFLLTNPAGYFMRYNGLLVAAEKRWSDQWQMLASYTVSKTEGLVPTSGAPAGSGQFSSTFGNANTFGRDPNTLTNAAGRLANDRTHVVRVIGSALIPRVGLRIATSAQYLTGAPWAASAPVALPQGLTRILLETPGTRRLSSQTLLDIRVSRVFSLAGKAQAELLLDVLNALNDNAEERLADENRFSQNFARPSVFIDPRRAMIGLRFRFQ
jgi:outer membrane receptor protein involved in Fe transport